MHPLLRRDDLTRITTVLELRDDSLSRSEPGDSRAYRRHDSRGVFSRGERARRQDLVLAPDYEEVWIVDCSRSYRDEYLPRTWLQIGQRFNAVPGGWPELPDANGLQDMS
jgi:hypothetical protein